MSERNYGPRFRGEEKGAYRKSLKVTNKDYLKMGEGLDDRLDKEFGNRAPRWKISSDWNHPWKSY